RVIAGACQMDPGSFPADLAGCPSVTRRSLCRGESFATPGARSDHHRNGPLVVGGKWRSSVAARSREITEGGLIDDPDEIDLHALGVRVWHSMTSDRAIPISVIFSVFQSRLTGALSQRLVAHPTVA